MASFWTGKPGLIKAEKQDDFCLDTGAFISIFKAELGNKLQLNIDAGKCFPKKIILADGSNNTRLWCEQKIAVYLGSGENHKKGIRVWFPVKRVDSGVGYEWDFSYQGKNLIGMRDVLNRWMLCFTTERVFVFARKVGV